MAVIAAQLVLDRGGSIQLDRRGSVTEIENRKYVKKYVLITDSLEDNPSTIRDTDGLPQIGETYTFGGVTSGATFDTLATCINIDIQPRQDSPYVWDFTATYDTSRLVGLVFDNPLNVPAEVSWTRTAYTRPLVQDLLGNALVNSSGEWFDPPVETEDTRPTLVVTRNELNYNPGQILAYQDAVNDDVFAGAPVRCAKINSITSIKQYDAGVTYWRTTYEIQFRRETFDLLVLDQGFRDVDHKLFLDPVSGIPLSTATLMNGRGKRLTTGTTTVAVDMAADDQSIQLTSVANFPPLLLFNNEPFAPNNYYTIKIGTELLQVVRDDGGGVLKVVRGYGGTTAVAHVSTTPVTLQPYFLRFQPFKRVRFADLALPTI